MMSGAACGSGSQRCGRLWSWVMILESVKMKTVFHGCKEAKRGHASRPSLVATSGTVRRTAAAEVAVNLFPAVPTVCEG